MLPDIRPSNAAPGNADFLAVNGTNSGRPVVFRKGRRALVSSQGCRKDFLLHEMSLPLIRLLALGTTPT